MDEVLNGASTGVMVSDTKRLRCEAAEFITDPPGHALLGGLVDDTAPIDWWLVWKSAGNTAAAAVPGIRIPLLRSFAGSCRESGRIVGCRSKPLNQLAPTGTGCEIACVNLLGGVGRNLTTARAQDGQWMPVGEIPPPEGAC
jgi:hypothetical protein